MNIDFNQKTKKMELSAKDIEKEINDLGAIYAMTQTPGWEALQRYFKKGEENLTQKIRASAIKGNEKDCLVLTAVWEGFRQWLTILDSLNDAFERYLESNKPIKNKEEKSDGAYGDARDGDE